MKILCVNCYCAKNTFDKLFNELKDKPEVSIQNYFNLLLSGLSKIGHNIVNQSERQISYKESGLFYKGYKEIDESNVKINYAPLITIPVLYQIWLFIYSFIHAFSYCIGKNKPDVIICDIMRFYSSFPTLLVSRLFGIKTIGFVADIPQMYNHQSFEKQSIVKRILKKIYSATSIYYDSYILLTEFMNEHVNTKSKPYIIIEGLVNKSENIEPVKISTKNTDEIVFMYSGGLFERYGVKMLIDAIVSFKDKNIKLWLFGKGDLESYINGIDSESIIFFGYKKHDIVVEMQMKADFLVNPRTSKEDFTKYSFPSKIMEYMVSGTPVISTRLKGIPNEYFDFLIPIEIESIEGIKKTINLMKNVPCDKRNEIGMESRKFVLENKNNVFQAQRLTEWIKVNVLNKR